MANPDKHIRLAAYDLLNDMVVSGNTIPCISGKVSGSTLPMFYVLLSSQTKRPTNKSKCGFQWDCSLLIDAVTRYDSTGNPGSRVLLNDIEEKILELMKSFAVTDLFSLEFESSDPADMDTDTENMFRQLIRYRIVINN